MARLLTAVTVIGLLLLQASAAAAQAAPFCAPGQEPGFEAGFAALRGRLSPVMGEPVECVHPDPATGDTLQRTTTGLAYWQRATNTPTFTNGFEHWALTAQGLLFWTGPSPTPPPEAVVLPPLARRTVPLVVSQGSGGSVLAFVPVFIGGEGPFAFALDTGASRSVIDQAIATQLGLPVVGVAGSINTIFGSGAAPVVRVAQWRMADVPLPPADALMVELAGPDPGADLRGLIGSDILSRFGTITVDYEQQVLVLGSSS